MDHHGAKCTQIDDDTCQGASRTCQNFFLFTNLAVGVTFLKVILHLLKKVLNRPFWISLAVISYFSALLFLTSLPRHCYIAQHCLSIHGGYWCKKNEILIKIWPDLLYFLSQFCIFSFQWSILLEFLSNRDILLQYCGTVAACFAFAEPIATGVSWHSLYCCYNNLAHFYYLNTAFSLVEPSELLKSDTALWLVELPVVRPYTTRWR